LLCSTFSVQFLQQPLSLTLLLHVVLEVGGVAMAQKQQVSSRLQKTTSFQQNAILWLLCEHCLGRCLSSRRERDGLFQSKIGLEKEFVSLIPEIKLIASTRHGSHSFVLPPPFSRERDAGAKEWHICVEDQRRRLDSFRFGE